MMESSVESEAVTNLNMEISVGAKTVPEGTDGAVDNVPGESLESVNDVTRLPLMIMGLHNLLMARMKPDRM